MRQAEYVEAEIQFLAPAVTHVHLHATITARLLVQVVVQIPITCVDKAHSRVLPALTDLPTCL